MIRTLAVLAGGFLGFAAALMLANSSTLEPIDVADLKGPGGYSANAPSGASFEGELDVPSAFEPYLPFGGDIPELGSGTPTRSGHTATTPVVAPTRTDRPSDLYRIQFELARLDCFAGSIDGAWSLEFHESLANIVLTRELDLSTLQDVEQVLEVLRATGPGVCEKPDVVAATDPTPAIDLDEASPPVVSSANTVAREVEAPPAERPDELRSTGVAIENVEAVITPRPGSELGKRSQSAATTYGHVDMLSSDATRDESLTGTARRNAAIRSYVFPELVDRHSEIIKFSDTELEARMLSKSPLDLPEIEEQVAVAPDLDVTEAAETSRTPIAHVEMDVEAVADTSAPVAPAPIEVAEAPQAPSMLIDDVTTADVVKDSGDVAGQPDTASSVAGVIDVRAPAETIGIERDPPVQTSDVANLDVVVERSGAIVPTAAVEPSVREAVHTVDLPAPIRVAAPLVVDRFASLQATLPSRQSDVELSSVPEKESDSLVPLPVRPAIGLREALQKARRSERRRQARSKERNAKLSERRAVKRATAARKLKPKGRPKTKTPKVAKKPSWKSNRQAIFSQRRN